MKSRFVPITLASAALLSVAIEAADTKVSRESADAFMQKAVQIATQGERGGRAGARRTSVSESELNSWFSYHAPPLLPKGVAEPAITMVGGGKVSGRAIVDLDAVAKRKATGGVLDPWSYIGGRVPVAVSGILHTKDGEGQFQLESAEVSGVPVPKMLLQEMVSYYTRTENHPSGINLDDRFELPANIQRIEVGQGQAVIVQ